MTHYVNYLAAVQELAHLNTLFASEEEQIQARRQAALQQSYGHVRHAQQQMDEIREDLRKLSQRTQALSRRYPEANVVSTRAASSIDDYPAALRSLARELDSIDTADAWLGRARSDLAHTQASRPAAVSRPVGSRVQGSRVGVPEPAPARKSGGIAWYWWAGGAAALAGIGGAVVSLLSGGG